MNITPISPQKLTFPTAKANEKLAQIESKPSLTQDAFVPSGSEKKSSDLKSALIGAGVGAALGSFAYGVVGKGTTPIPEFIPFNRGMIEGTFNTLAAAKTVMCSGGLGLGAAVVGPAFGMDSMSKLGAPGAIFTGLLGGVVLATGSSLLHSLAGVPPLVAGAITGGAMGFLGGLGSK